MIMNAVGINVFRRKSTVAVLRSSGLVLMKPFDISHQSAHFQTLAKKAKGSRWRNPYCHGVYRPLL